MVSSDSRWKGELLSKGNETVGLASATNKKDDQETHFNSAIDINPMLGSDTGSIPKFASSTGMKEIAYDKKKFI